MPIERSPIEAPGFQSPSPVPHLNPLEQLPGMSWLHDQQTPYDQLWKDIGDFRPGSIKGGFTDAQAYALSPEHQSLWTYERPSLGLASPAGPDPAAKTPISRGTLSLSAIDPLSIPYQFTGQPQGVNLAPAGAGPSGFNPGAFLSERGIDVMGNLPSRWLDYAFAAPNIITGQAIVNPAPSPDGSKTPYEFQYDGRYWGFVGTANDAQIKDLAARTAQQYTADPLFTRRLTEQMMRDRDAATGLSSGNDGVDYVAKVKLYQDMVAGEAAALVTHQQVRVTGKGGSYVVDQPTADIGPQISAGYHRLVALGVVYAQGIPFVGTDLAKSFNPIPADVEDYWKNSLTPEQRNQYLGTAGLLTTLSTTAWTLPLLSGWGTVTKLAAMGKLGAAGSMTAKAGQTAFAVYNTTLKATAAAMAFGLSSLMANTAREWVDPQYAATVGASIDASRPISDSAAAAIVNGVGYFASGTGGASLLLRGGRKVLGGVTAATGTLADTSIYSFGLGGSTMTRALSEATGIAKDAFHRSVQRLTMSELGGELMDRQVRQMEDGLAAMNRGELSGIAELDAIEDPALRTAWANERLMQMQEMHHASVTMALNLMSTAKKLLGFTSSDIEHQRVLVAQRMTRAIEDDVARRFTTKYGSDFWMLKNANNLPGVKKWLTDQAKRLGLEGFDITKLEKQLGKNLNRWHQAARQMYHYEYDLHNATLQEAAKGSGEQGRLTLVRQTHLFAHEAEGIITGLRSGDDALIHAAKNEVGVRIDLHDTEELNAWWSRKLGLAHGPASVLDMSPESIAADLEAMQPTLMHQRMPPDPAGPHADQPINKLHTALEQQGEWTLAYKPEFISEYMPDVGIPGEQQQPRFASFKVLPDGTVLKSPFMDYQFEGAENIAVGNRGVMLSKLDEVTRGWRTWRITEFQRSSLFRILDGSGFLPNQIDRFFRDVVKLSREEKFSPGRTRGHLLVKVNPQAVGVLASEERLAKMGERAFGPGGVDKLPARYKHADGTADWGRLIIDGFQQSRSLNLLAGVTSMLKTLPNGVGHTAILASDWAVPLVRFNLSALFRIGEGVESGALNLMRVADPMADDLTLAAYRKAGVGIQRGAAAAEIGAEPMAGMLGDPAHGPASGAAQSMAMFTRGAAPEEKAALNAAQAKAAPGVQLPDVSAIQATHQAKLSAIIDNTPLAPGVGTVQDPILVQRISDFVAKAPEDIMAARTWQPGNPASQEEIDRLAHAIVELRQTPIGMDGLMHVADPKNPGGPLLAIDADPAEIAKQSLAWRQEINTLKAHGTTNRPPRIAVAPTQGYDLAPPHSSTLPTTGGFGQMPEYDEITQNEPGLWHATKALDKVLSEGLRSGGETGITGLGGSSGVVSLTYSEKKAQTIVESQQLMAGFVNGKATPEDVINYYWDRPPYNGSPQQIADVLSLKPAWVGANPDLVAKLSAARGEIEHGTGKAVDPETGAELTKADLKNIQKRIKVASGKHAPWDGSVENLIAALAARDDEMLASGHAAQQQWRHRVITWLDNYQNEDTPEGQPVLYVGNYKDWVGVDPENIGYVQVATRDMPTAGTSEYELRYNADTLQVIDPRAPSFIPGFEDLRFDIQHKVGLHPDDKVAINQALGDYVREIRAKLAEPEVPDAQVPLTNAHIAGSPENVQEHMEQIAEQRQPGMGKVIHALFNPGPFKEAQALKLEIAMIQHDFPLALQAAGSDAYKVMKEAGWADLEMADKLVQDRALYQRWQNTGSDEDWQALMDHSSVRAADGRLERPQDELYKSPEWEVVSSLWRLSAQAAQDEAFGVHFFGRYRSTLERSINHPLLGVYPASWAYKVAKEWVRFLYDNRMFGGGTLRLGMAPAVAIANIQRAQQRAFAQSNEGDLNTFLDKGPFKNALFMFNLVMPGDWSSIPFPLSQSIRLAVMRGDWNPVDHLARNTWGLNGAGGIGGFRDARLLASTIGDAWDTFTGAAQHEADARWNALITTTSGQGLPRKPPDWNAITTYPH